MGSGNVQAMAMAILSATKMGWHGMGLCDEYQHAE
jgi:hypothetical protein